MKLFIILMTGMMMVGLVGCTTVGKRECGETLKIRGIGKAEWPDGAKIEGKPMLSFPERIYER